jgi:hypothetical protein
VLGVRGFGSHHCPPKPAATPGAVQIKSERSGSLDMCSARQASGAFMPRMVTYFDDKSCASASANTLAESRSY